MNDYDRFLKGLFILSNRVESLLKEGYQVMFQYKQKDLCLIKMCHKNGNIIILKLKFPDGILLQHTNGKRKFEAKVC